jgi:orotate phosphoribosyltransferase
MNYKPLMVMLYKIGAVKFGDFTLKSGEQSKIDIDLRQIVSYPDVLKAVAEAMWQQVSGEPFEVICGVPYTALPIATCISLQQNIPMVMRRKEKKEYGTKQTIEGNIKTGQRCLIVEDIITSGASILETADDLEVAGFKVRDAVVLINREQGGAHNLRQRHYNLHATFTLKDFLNTLLHSEELSEQDRMIASQLMHEGEVNAS